MSGWQRSATERVVVVVVQSLEARSGVSPYDGVHSQLPPIHTIAASPPSPSHQPQSWQP